VIAVFTKYDQFKLDIEMKLEDEGHDIDSALLSTRAENIFKDKYLAHLSGSPPFVRLESEDYVN
jgi:hypothetical protein